MTFPDTVTGPNDVGKESVSISPRIPTSCPGSPSSSPSQISNKSLPPGVPSRFKVMVAEVTVSVSPVKNG